jgi:hypothetical protein
MHQAVMRLAYQYSTIVSSRLKGVTKSVVAIQSLPGNRYEDINPTMPPNRKQYAAGFFNRHK